VWKKKSVRQKIPPPVSATKPKTTPRTKTYYYHDRALHPDHISPRPALTSAYLFPLPAVSCFVTRTHSNLPIQHSTVRPGLDQIALRLLYFFLSDLTSSPSPRLSPSLLSLLVVISLHGRWKKTNGQSESTKESRHSSNHVEQGEAANHTE
jgi:hypothetical protein